MELRADALIPFPLELVFTAYRDHLPDMLPYLPNVRAIEVRKREDDGDIVKILNFWRGGGDIPAAARAFLSEAMLSWLDDALWDNREHTCAWKIAPQAFTDAITCEGKNRFVEEQGKTRLEIRGQITVDAKKVKGVPGFLASKVSHTIEDFLISKIKPNLVSTAEGLTRYLEARNADARSGSDGSPRRR